MSNIKDKAFSYYKALVLDNCTYGTDDISTEDVINAFIEFGKQVCEEQKQECAESCKEDIGVLEYLSNIKYFDDENSNDSLIDRDSILNCKNVCEN